MLEIHLRRNSDGLVRVVRQEGHWERVDADDESEAAYEFIWTDGNYACDCNRYLFFQRAAEEAEEDEIQCGDERYSIVKIVQDGRELDEDYPL